MWRWGYRSFLEERASLAASAAGVAVIFLLVMILEGAFQGEADQVVAFIERTDATVWVMQKGVANMHMASSALGADVAAQLQGVPGVASVEGILYSGGLAQIGRQERAIYLVGIRPGQRVGPWDLLEGRGRPAAGEVVVPAVLARNGGVELGATVTIARRPFKVVGLSRGTYSMANSLAFIHASDLASLFDVVADANYYLVWPAPGVSAAELATRVRGALPGVSVLERDALVENDRDLALKMGGELIRIMTVVAGLVAALIVGFTVFTFMARRARELAVAKAVGARAQQLLGAAMGQAAALGLAGFLLSAGLAAVLQPVFARYAPGVIIHFTLASTARIGVAALVVSIVAGTLPAWRVLRVDPTLVFSS
jgi:ABC-type antimicrobial peptide transport system permease subunit